MLRAAGNGSELLIGGSGAARKSILWESAFNGCLWGVRINGILLPFDVGSELDNAAREPRFEVLTRDHAVGHDCTGRNQCGVGGPGYGFCAHGGQCVDDWNNFHCECPAGYTGRQCVVAE